MGRVSKGKFQRAPFQKVFQTCPVVACSTAVFWYGHNHKWNINKSIEILKLFFLAHEYIP